MSGEARPGKVVQTYEAVCSNRPTPSVQKGPKGSQWWRRDVYHIAGDAGKTLCGRSRSDWLTIGKIEINADCCSRCAAIVQQEVADAE